MRLTQTQKEDKKIQQIRLDDYRRTSITNRFTQITRSHQLAQATMTTLIERKQFYEKGIITDYLESENKMNQKELRHLKLQRKCLLKIKGKEAICDAEGSFSDSFSGNENPAGVTS